MCTGSVGLYSIGASVQWMHNGQTEEHGVQSVVSLKKLHSWVFIGLCPNIYLISIVVCAKKRLYSKLSADDLCSECCLLTFVSAIAAYRRHGLGEHNALGGASRDIITQVQYIRYK